MINLKHISVAFGGKQVLRDVSCRFEAGKHYALFGPSGCGKTTLLRVIAGLQKPDAGEVIHARDLRMAFCFQEDRLLPWYTVRRNVMLALPPECQKDKEKAARIADAWLERVGLAGEGDAYPSALSGGMKRRAALARALAFDAPVMLMDEPFRALDEASHADMLRLVRSLAQGRTLILVTHDISDTEGMDVIHFQ
ncbi:MAG: ABC transporter ATP-binding protein [Clostridia bacterium]|nr:ABC transporter ATP-binding protein [Clostridia bacterium]